MVAVSISQATLVMHIRIKPDQKISFAAWQSQFHAAIASFKGFTSLEITSPNQNGKLEWSLKQCFENEEDLKAWCDSAERKALLKSLEPMLISDTLKALFEESISNQMNGVTEVFVTTVSPSEVKAYRQWIGKIHEAEMRFPGFQRVYVQAPYSEKSETWVTLLQFDTVDHLDEWLQSKERKEILEEARLIVLSLESHRVTSSFAGWFGNLTMPPPVWKQTMLVLLVLYPIVMLELKYLMPWTTYLNLSLGTFIGNALSVSLVSWPMMPLAIFFLRWWLSPAVSSAKALIGTMIVSVLYLIEIGIFWYF